MDCERSIISRVDAVFGIERRRPTLMAILEVARFGVFDDYEGMSLVSESSHRVSAAVARSGANKA